MSKGGETTSTTQSGFAQEYKPQISEMLDASKGLYDSGQLGKVAGFTPAQLAAQEAGTVSAGVQTGLEQNLASIAGQPVDLSGMRTAAQTEARNALGLNAGGAYQRGGLGGSRERINQESIANNLAGRFAGIDQQAQQQQMANLTTALGAQGAGAGTLAGIGAGQQSQAQNEADAAYKALAQRAGLFTGMADKASTTTQTGGK